MKSVTVEVENKIATITFSRPPVNAVNLPANIELAEAFESMKERDDVSVVIFQSTGKGFMSGSDVTDFKSLTSDRLLAEYEGANIRTFEAIFNCPVPVICAAQGYVLSLGLCYAASCDFIIASEDAYFGLAEVKVATLGGSDFLRKLVPQALARYMSYTGKYIGVEEIAKYGNILRIVPRDRLLDECRKVAAEIAVHYTKTVRYYKEVLNHSNGIEQYADKFRFEADYTHKLRNDPVRAQVLKAFEEKRK